MYDFEIAKFQPNNFDDLPSSMLPLSSPSRFLHGGVIYFIWILVWNSVVIKASTEPLWSNVCQQPQEDPFPFCDSTRPIEERVKDYVGRIPIPAQIAMMGNDADGYEPLGIPPYQWWSEGLHGPLEPCVTYEHSGTTTATTIETKCATSFPCPSGLGNTFNTTLYRKMGGAIGQEGRAISILRDHDMSVGDGLTYWSPNVNLQRDPRWGRNQEAPGEDPLLTSEYAKNFILGLQELRQRSWTTDGNNDDHSTHNDDNNRLQMAACCKHYVANSLENWKGHTRHNFDAQVSEKDLNEYYLVPFRTCVESGAAGIMCSYNSVNGIPSCVNKELQQDILRNKWGFDGYLVTDCGALVDTYDTDYGHDYTKDPKDASAQAKNASVDLNCGDTFRKGLLAAYEEGVVDAETITESFRRMATIQFRLGLFDEKDYDPVEAIQMVGSHHSLALEAARQSIVLLKNEDNLLPLEPNLSVALIGPHIFGQEVFLSNYYGDVCSDGGEANFDCMERPVEAFQKIVKNPVTYIQGCHVEGEDLDEIETAVKLAQEADRIILLMGLNVSIEAEELDRVETTLPGLQTRLIQEVLEVAGERTILVLIHGGAMSLGTEILSTSGAILSASYGGIMASQAIVDVIYGHYNPTGKLSATMYPPSYVDEIPLTEMSLTEGPGRTHMYYTGIPEFPFGHGLSYSRWDLEWHKTSEPDVPWILSDDDDSYIRGLRIGVNVTNLGPHIGSQTVLLFWYLAPPPTTTTTTTTRISSSEPKQNNRLRQKLAGFQGTTRPLNVNESEILEFQINLQTFELWQEKEEHEEEGTSTFRVQNGIYFLEARGSNGITISRSIEIQLGNDRFSLSLSTEES